MGLGREEKKKKERKQKKKKSESKENSLIQVITVDTLTATLHFELLSGNKNNCFS